VLAWFLSLFRRGRPREASPIREADAYARSYGERSGEIVSVVRLEP
jgi:DNA-directed RNA polymerase subunit H (RpoH/RPB5)